MELEEKVAIVTGAGQGMGKAIALELAKAGASLALADIREDTTEKVKNDIEKMGRAAVAIQMDVAIWKDAERTAQTAMERFGRIDILVNNAGISPKGKGGVALKILDIDDEVWDRVIDVNLKGVFNCCKAVMPFLISQRSGRIVNIGSVSGLTGGAGTPVAAPYCASKSGVYGLTKLFARELAQYNINVNVIAPGRIFTEMAQLTSAEANEEMRRQTPLGKFGRPMDIARGVLYLVLESGDFITGETLVIDGGRTMH